MAADIAAPEFEEITGAAVVTFRVPVAGAESRAESKAESLDCRILAALRTEDQSKAGRATTIGLSSVTGQLNRSVATLLERGLVAMTFPDKPNSLSRHVGVGLPSCTWTDSPSPSSCRICCSSVARLPALSALTLTVNSRPIRRSEPARSFGRIFVPSRFQTSGGTVPTRRRAVMLALGAGSGPGGKADSGMGIGSGAGGMLCFGVG